MQKVQTREQPERISWARAMIFGVGFFFIAAILIGQLPSYVNLQLTASTLQGLEQSSLALGLVCIAGFLVVQAVVMLFDPKPVVPPIIFIGLGVIILLGGLALLLWSVLTIHVGPHNVISNNQFVPQADVSWNPLLNGNVLWLESGSIDLVMVGTILMGVGGAWFFYGMLARGEQTNPDRSDRGTTSLIRILVAISTVVFLVYLIFSTFVDPTALAKNIDPVCPTAVNVTTCTSPITGLFIINAILNTLFAIAIVCVLVAFALRLHYLMRPVRKNTMSGLYAVGVNLLPFGALFVLLWLFAYPLVDWIHSWTFIGLGGYLTLCGKKSAIPQSCSFSQQGGYIVDTLITGGFFTVLMAAIWAWKSKRNLVIIGGVVVSVVLSLTTLVVHTSPGQVQVAMVLTGSSLILATIWTSVARREFAVVGERNLGCIGQWLVVGTCLLIYLAAFALFSIPGSTPSYPPETQPNIPFAPGLAIPGGGAPDAVITFVLIGALAAIQFYFLVRNRYKV